MHSKIIGMVFAVMAAVILLQHGFRFAPFIFIWFAIRDFTDRSTYVS